MREESVRFSESLGTEIIMAKVDGKTIADNRKARHDYFVIETYEAGIELFGTEVKSLRAGTVNLKDAYCEIDGGELFALGVHISPYEQGNIFNKDPLRPKRLLMHKREIMKLAGLVSRDGYTLVPLSLYFKGSNVKMAVGLCKGKKMYDKRDDAAKRDADRTIEKAMKNRF
jgi:SsrA-binding protein